MSTERLLTIVAFGDSITAATQQAPQDRWPEILRGALQARFPACPIRMINAGVGGNTSREGLARFERDVLAHQPHYVTMEFGNDATYDPLRHVSLEEFAANLEGMAARTMEGDRGRVWLLTFPPIINAWHACRDHAFFKPHGGQDAYQDRYRQRTRQLAHARGLPLVDIDQALRAEMAVHGPEPYILSDGVHLTAAGNRVVADAVRPFMVDAINMRLSPA